MFNTLRSFALSALFITALLVAGCGVNDSEVETPAQAIVEVAFSDAESGEAVAGADAEVSAIYDGETDPVGQGSLVTDQNGEFSGLITNPNEVVITTLIFRLYLGDEEYLFEEDVNLELTREEPYDSVNLSFEVDTTGENGDEE